MKISHYLPNAKPWIEKSLNNNWDALSDIVPPELMPSQERLLKSGRMTFAKEYGCGVYGCVLPTGKKDTVFKMTTDFTEASFVAAMLEAMPELPEGIVRYKAVVELPEKKGKDKEPIFAIWREEARDIGFLTGKGSSLSSQGADPRELRRSFQECRQLLGSFGHAAEKVMDYYMSGRSSKATVQALEVAIRDVPRLIQEEPDTLKGSKLAAHWLGGAYLIALELSKDFVGTTLGDALAQFIDTGFVLADVHLNNVGIVDRKGVGAVVAITDPGHAIPLKTKYWKYPVPHLLDRDVKTTRRMTIAANN